MFIAVILVVLIGGFFYFMGSSKLSNSTYIHVPNEELKFSTTEELTSNFITLDFETTGLDFHSEKIVEIGAAKFIDGVKLKEFHAYVNPEMKIPAVASDIHGITDDKVEHSKTIDDLLPELLNFIGSETIVVHNAKFDISFLLTSLYAYNEKRNDKQLEFTNVVADTLPLSRKYIRTTVDNKLDTLKDYLGFKNLKSHSALDDAFVTGQLYLHFQMVEDNIKGKAFEKDGKIDEAIDLYEDNLNRNFADNHPYERLAIIYRRKKQYDQEIRVLNHAINVFEGLTDSQRKDAHGQLEKFKERLVKVEAKLNK